MLISINCVCDKCQRQLSNEDIVYWQYYVKNNNIGTNIGTASFSFGNPISMSRSLNKTVYSIDINTNKRTFYKIKTNNYKEQYECYEHLCMYCIDSIKINRDFPSLLKRLENIQNNKILFKRINDLEQKIKDLEKKLERNKNVENIDDECREVVKYKRSRN